jgi:REP element-mobilizing transposase RayT
MARQLSFFRTLGCATPRIEHGGEVRLRRRKLTRPIDTRRPLHVVLRSTRARGAWSLRTRVNDGLIRATLRRYARRYAVRLYEFANAGNHLHLLLRPTCRIGLQNFLRVFAGVSARLVTRARKGRPIGRFWDFLAYSRIVQWGRDFFGVRTYVRDNELEPHASIRRRSPGPFRKTQSERQLE